MLGCRLAAAGLIRPLAWEFPYAVGAALKSPKSFLVLQGLGHSGWNRKHGLSHPMKDLQRENSQKTATEIVAGVAVRELRLETVTEE